MSDSQSLGTRPAERAARAPRSLRVLVADDDRDAVLTLTAILRHEGHEVKAVYNGGDVVQAAREFLPDVALLDIGMPQMTGYDAARHLRARYGRQMVLVAVTGWKQPSDRILATLAGFDHHLAKPFDPQALCSLLSSLPPSG